MTVRILNRQKMNGVIFYTLSNGWEILTAQCTQDWPWRHRFSIWRPDANMDAGGEWFGGAKTLAAALAMVPEQAEKPADAPLFQETE